PVLAQPSTPEDTAPPTNGSGSTTGSGSGSGSGAGSGSSADAGSGSAAGAGSGAGAGAASTAGSGWGPGRPTAPRPRAGAATAGAVATADDVQLDANGMPILLGPDGKPIELAETIEINDEAPAESASSVHLTRDELGFRSRTQVSDILRQVPGLMVSQHAGGGKSDQYFIRGFDADHGTDIAIFADGVPVTMPSHGHGQGYADTHFLIPETIGTVDVHKGPYSARFGDFYTAGAMELQTIDHVDGPTLWVAGGAPLAGPKSFDQYNRRLVGMASPELRGNSTDRSLIAAQIAD